ncbi:hypothetical protein BC829DRAFT_415255 [Chytridium lagenaria]|nr:hypothetical protein BC829DRAFT_415255 [Chytridium lagenaria]
MWEGTESDGECFGIRTSDKDGALERVWSWRKQMEYTEMGGDSRTMRQGLEFGTDLGLKETKERERNRFDTDIRKNMGTNVENGPVRQDTNADITRFRKEEPGKINGRCWEIGTGKTEQASGSRLIRLGNARLRYLDGATFGWYENRDGVNSLQADKATSPFDLLFCGKGPGEAKRGFEMLLSHAAEGYELMKGRSFLTFMFVSIRRMIWKLLLETRVDYHHDESSVSSFSRLSKNGGCRGAW